VNRCWLITSTTYATWLPGDERGFVSPVESDSGPRVRHNVYGTPYDAYVPPLRASAQNLMKGPPVYLLEEQALVIRDQFLETVQFRGWELHATSIMANHVHAVVEAAGEVPSTKILGDLKSYASRALNRRWARPISGTWWTESGSRRPLRDEFARVGAVLYVVTRQHCPLVVWYAPGYQELITASLSGGVSPLSTLSLSIPPSPERGA
jgi:REP element-mobilizing transposase RayT